MKRDTRAKNTKTDPKQESGEPSTETHSGTPNPVDPNSARSTEHKSGYGGEGGEPRTSTDKREKPEP